MLITRRNKYILTIDEVYFTDNYCFDSSGADITVFFQSSKEIEGCRLFHTLHIDLNKEEEVIFSEVSKNIKYEINRAMTKDNLVTKILNSPSKDEISEFSIFFNAFAVSKNLTLCNEIKLQTLNEKDALTLSLIKDKHDNILCYHAYITDKKRARLLYSASLFRLSQDTSERALIGRANRLLHWTDIKVLKEMGFMVYDFGGLSLDSENISLKNIDDFKKGFGGKVVTEYNYYYPRTFLGKMAMMYFNWRGWG